MSKSKTIALCGLSDDDKIVLATLINLLAMKTSEKWILTEKEDADVTIVNIDSHRGKLFTHSERTKHKAAIEVTSGDPPRTSAPRLRKPLRARDLLRCLEELSEVEPAAQPILTGKVYPERGHQIFVVRMHIKPPPAFVDRWPGGQHMCQLLMRHTLTVDKVAALSDVPQEQVQQFVDQCVANGFAEEKLITLAEPSFDHPPAGESMLAKLRMRLGYR